MHLLDFFFLWGFPQWRIQSLVKAVLLRLQCVYLLPELLVKCRFWFSWSGVGLRVCIHNCCCCSWTISWITGGVGEDHGPGCQSGSHVGEKNWEVSTLNKWWLLPLHWDSLNPFAFRIVPLYSAVLHRPCASPSPEVWNLCYSSGEGGEWERQLIGQRERGSGLLLVMDYEECLISFRETFHQFCFPLIIAPFPEVPGSASFWGLKETLYVKPAGLQLDSPSFWI